MPRPNPEKPHRTELVAVRFRPEEAKALRLLAERDNDNASVSAVIRRLVRQALDQEAEAA